MIIIAVDQSYTCTGIVVLDDGNMIHAEIFSTDKTKDIFERAWEVVQKVAQLNEQYKPHVIAMEGLAFGSRGNATRDLAGLQFSIATNMRFVHHTDTRIVAPGTVKKLATGKGNSKKIMLLECLPDDIREAFDAMGVKKSTGLLDLTDAYWIGQTVEQANR